MGFFSDTELASLTIERMNFQIVGEGGFDPRPAMAAVEHADFFIGRIREVDVASAFSFADLSETKTTIEDMAAGRTRFANGAVALAREFDRHHVGQSKAGAFFVFELGGGDAATKLYALLKYDYSEVLTLRQRGAGDQLRRIVQAFVKDKRALQKSALVRVVDGVAEIEVSATDRGARSPSITDFFTRFLNVHRERDDIELNKAASDALHDIMHSVPSEVWPDNAAAALARMREALRTSAVISDDVVRDAVWVAAGRPEEDEVIELLRDHANSALRKRRIAGLEFPPNASVFRVASKRRIKTVENIKIEYPDSLSGVKVTTERAANGSAVITIQTDHIESDEVVSESIGNVRRLTP
jgi:hypothetical protein